MAGTRLAVGVDVGGTTTKGVLVTDQGEVLRETTPVPSPTTGAEEVADTAAAVAAELLAGLGPDVPVGVCVPGIVDEAAGLGIFSANLGWRDAPMRDLVTSRLGRAVTLGHDVRSGALGEAIWGLKEPNCLYVAIGTGVATGLVLGSRLTPTTPWSGELGQVPVPHPDQPGVLVPLEKVSSAAGIAARAVAWGLLPEGSNARDVQELAESTDPAMAARAARALEVQNSSLALIGQVLSVVVHQVGTVTVVIGGGVSKGGEAILHPIRRALDAGCPLVPVPEVTTARLGSSSQAIGVAAAAFMDAGIPLTR